MQFIHCLKQVTMDNLKNRAARLCWPPRARQEHTGKQPYFIHLEGEPVMRMAGLFDAWKGEDGEMLYTYTILTTNSSPRLQWCAAARTCQTCLGWVRQVARGGSWKRGALQCTRGLSLL